MKRTLIGALCLSLLATGCSDQPQPEAEQDSQATSEAMAGSSDTPMAEADANAEDAAEAEKIKARMLALLEEMNAMQNAIQAHDVEAMRKVLKEGADLTLQPSENTYATECVLANFPEGLKVLKEFNFDFDMRNKRNGAPALLCVAAEGGDFNRLEMARILLECGASVDAEVEDPEDPSLDGFTPLCLALHRAFFENDKESLAVAQFLLKHGADPDKTPVCNEGQTMLQTAIFEKNFPAVEFLLKHGASVTKARDDGVTALKIVTQRGIPAKIRQAVAANAKVCDFTIFGITLGQPLPESIGGKFDDWSLEGDIDWEMPRPFRRFEKASLEQTVNSHRIASILLTCEVGSDLQQVEEAEAIRKALEQKFDLGFQLPAYAVETGFEDGKVTWRLKEGYEKTPMESKKGGVTIKIYPNGYNGFSSRHEVSLRISVTDEEALQQLDGLAAPVVETDLDVL